MSSYDLEIIEGQIIDMNIEDDQITFYLLDLTQERKIVLFIHHVTRGTVVLHMSYLDVSIDVSTT